MKSAYISASLRGQGLGAALLSRCVEWADGHGFNRLFVEHETANLAGADFWARFLGPYATYSKRYVDDSL